MKLTKKEVWQKIKQRPFKFPLKEEVFSLIEENFDRVDFVIDHVGIRDFLFIVEDTPNLLAFTANLFTTINVACEKDYSFKKNLELSLYKYNSDASSSLKALKELFKETERMLYIGVGFKESQKIDEAKFTEEILSGKYGTQEEVLKALRKFPEWYSSYAKDPKDIQFITVKAEKFIRDVLQPLEKYSIKNRIDNILMKQELTEKDKVLLKALMTYIKK
ncbi:hypothetical protein [Priestia megaterium]|uniref:Uncharacterized protein n=1 Tax=Priestia megaterium TaxID=1404 RepID=A0A6M6E4J9_PRIMG|nr:hypothetical protein [Priestia megaterium]QJX80099.1 hypothetical protein FDZ14_28805 [Priestia megaterium]